ncbi:uncharacterized protein A4U43_C09F6420 [Asparagus officinalis]|uniref:Uncharacterized protein n=1 Tax=Asparagus officinalis TaxID=4686 RepID=A0A5P1E5S2_ASPOF|nr:tetratricopeptide repeat protein 33 [Asparagus officinalis]ONK57981.1 uncharacterized protein A4U43_C09F6420 [Asparagus officinalis]
MKIVWKKKPKEESGKKRARAQPLALNPNLPFEREEESDSESQNEKKRINTENPSSKNQNPDQIKTAESFESQGNQLAEDGKYSEALQKWEAAIVLVPGRAILHEQKAQVLLEMGDSWSALKAATRASELEPLWAEAWITLGRAQLNYGEPDLAIKSFDKALEIKPNHEEALVDRETASHLVKRRKQLHSTDNIINQTRYKVRDEAKCSDAPVLIEDEVENSDAPALHSEENQRANEST